MAQAAPTPVEHEGHAPSGLLLPRRETDTSTDMDITPMIDITFLLLIFFLVATAMDPQRAIELPEAHYGDGVNPDEAAIITLGYEEGQEAAIFLGNGKDPQLRVQGPWRQVRQQILQYLEQQLASGEKTTVLIKAERGVNEGIVYRIEQLVGESGYSTLYQAVMETD